MSKVTELENALTELFRKGTEVGYSETEIDEFLEDIDYDTLLQAVWNNAETVYSYRADGEHEFSMDYRGTELFKQRATLLYEDMGEGFAGAVVAARSMELWLLEDMGFAIVANFYVEVGNGEYISEYRVYKGSDWTDSDLDLDLEDLVAELAAMCEPYYDHNQPMQGSLSQMAFARPTEEQLGKIYTLDYIDVVGVGASVATTNDIPGLSKCPISYVDQTQWKKMFCPTYTNIVGHYPEKENEIMLSRYLLDILGLENIEIGMTIPLSFEVDGATITEDFVLACTYTEYSHLRTGGDIQIYCSKAFAENHHALETSKLTVNIIFENDCVAENIEKLKADLPFYENQPYIQSPAFGDANGSVMTYLALGILVLFLMFAGYLLIYNLLLSGKMLFGSKTMKQIPTIRFIPIHILQPFPIKEIRIMDLGGRLSKHSRNRMMRILMSWVSTT